MKTFLSTLIMYFILSSQLFSQLTGNGTVGSPYSGTISVNTEWFPDTYPGRIIYAQNITLSSGASLTISPGVYVGGLLQFYDGTLTIGSGSAFVVNPQTAVTVTDIINNGILRLESDPFEAGVASLIHETYDASGGGTTQIRLSLSGGSTAGGQHIWHYISVPVSNVNVSTFATLDFAQYIENLVVGPDNFPGWVASDGYQYSTGTTLGNTFSTLSVGKGYNYYSASNNIFTLTGDINIISKLVPVTCGSGYPYYQGFNLIGNPFASCLDWDDLIQKYPPAFVNNAIYFTLNGTSASYIGGIGTNGATGTIPPMQGFFIKANPGVASVRLRSETRTHNLEQMRYKKGGVEVKKSSDTISFFRLKIESADDSSDLVVRFNKKASTGVDNLFDAYKFSKTIGAINIWTKSPEVDYSINGLPFPESIIEIPVGLNVKTPGSFKFTLDEYNRIDNYSVLLTDLYTNVTVDLKKDASLFFNTAEGTAEDRFVLKVINLSTDIQDSKNSEKKFSIYSYSGAINIIALTDEFSNISGSVNIYDLAGRKVYQQSNIEWQSNGELRQIMFASPEYGLYIVEIKLGNKRYIEKVNILR